MVAAAVAEPARADKAAIPAANVAAVAHPTAVVVCVVLTAVAEAAGRAQAGRAVIPAVNAQRAVFRTARGEFAVPTAAWECVEHVPWDKAAIQMGSVVAHPIAADAPVVPTAVVARAETAQAGRPATLAGSALAREIAPGVSAVRMAVEAPAERVRADRRATPAVNALPTVFPTVRAALAVPTGAGARAEAAHPVTPVIPQANAFRVAVRAARISRPA